MGTRAAVSAPQPLAPAGRQGMTAWREHTLPTASRLSEVFAAGGWYSSMSTQGQSFPWCLTFGARSRKLSKGQKSAYPWHECDQMPDPKCLLESVKDLVKKLLRIVYLLSLAFT